MLIPLFPQVTGFKVENLWSRGSRGAVRCTARLSRPLRTEEIDRIERLEATSVDRSEVVYECRAEEIEQWHTKLANALAGAAWAPARRVAVGERKRTRGGSRTRPDPPRRPEPAA